MICFSKVWSDDLKTKTYEYLIFELVHSHIAMSSGSFVLK